MKQKQHYLTGHSQCTAAVVVKGIDRDVEWGEDILMLGLGIVMLSSTFRSRCPTNGYFADGCARIRDYLKPGTHELPRDGT